MCSVLTRSSRESAMCSSHSATRTSATDGRSKPARANRLPTYGQGRLQLSLETNLRWVCVPHSDCTDHSQTHTRARREHTVLRRIDRSAVSRYSRYENGTVQVRTWYYSAVQVYILSCITYIALATRLTTTARSQSLDGLSVRYSYCRSASYSGVRVVWDPEPARGGPVVCVSVRV